MTPIIIMYTYQ